MSRCPDGQLEKADEVRAVKYPATWSGGFDPWFLGRISLHWALDSLLPLMLVTWVSRTVTVEACLSPPVNGMHLSDF